jgi:integrase
MAGKYKRGRIWWGRAQRGGKEFRQSLKTGDRLLAEKRLQEWVRDLDGLAWGERPRVSFGEAVRQFLINHAVNLKPRSAQRYGSSLKWLIESLGHLYVDQIGRQQMADFETLRRSMVAKGRHGATVSNPTIRRDLACLSSVMTYCEDRDWLGEGRNPVPGYLRRRSRRGLKEAPSRTRYLSEAEEDALLVAANDELLRIALMLAIDTGLREQELFTLKWPQIDFRRGVITTTADTKNKRIRMVPLAQRSAQALLRLKGMRMPNLPSLYVFHHEDGSRFRNLSRRFKSALKRAKITGFRWHDLRRTAGCRWRQRDGIPLEQISVLLGHSSYLVTERAYAFLDGSRIAEQVAAQKSARSEADS